MAVLTVKNFSCVNQANIKLAKITVLIGPQASGKSVLSKLVYFFYEILEHQYRELEEGDSLEEYRATIAEKFKKWFPPSAWGSRNFEISFKAGPFFVKIHRTGPKRKNAESEAISVLFSPWFETQYNSFRTRLSAANKKDDRRPYRADTFWRLREEFEKKISDDLKSDYVSWQLFVPAGRSFFTSVGKAMTAFEHSGMLDPITVAFGRFFSFLRDQRRNRGMRLRSPSGSEQRVRDEMMRSLFGGRIMFGRDSDYVESYDGRKIPFATLSSGQQELLPLWLSIEYSQEGIDRNMIYVEEPEAHLFPSAQSQIIEHMASSMGSSKGKMLLTTHSPYVLTQLNIFLKAGALSEEFPDKQKQIANVVHPKYWLSPASTAAYAIVGKRVRSILLDGILDADYLDEVSGDLSRDFTKLLEIEISK